MCKYYFFLLVIFKDSHVISSMGTLYVVEQSLVNVLVYVVTKLSQWRVLIAVKLVILMVSFSVTFEIAT